MLKTDILLSFMSMILRVFQHHTKQDQYKQLLDPSYYRFITNPELAQIMIRVFAIGIVIPNSPNNMTILNITGLQVLDNQINQLKTVTLTCINHVLKNKDKQCELLIQGHQHQIVNGLLSLVPIVVQSVIIFGQRSDLQLLVEEETIASFVVELQEVLINVAPYEQFKANFTKVLPHLILDVCLQLIKTSETER